MYRFKACDKKYINNYKKNIIINPEIIDTVRFLYLWLRNTNFTILEDIVLKIIIQTLI